MVPVHSPVLLASMRKMNGETEASYHEPLTRPTKPSAHSAPKSNTTSIKRTVAAGFLRRAVEAMRRYARDVQQSHEELSASTQEQALPNEFVALGLGRPG